MHSCGGFPYLNQYIFAGYMPLFFICSGLTLHHKNKSLKEFMNNKTKRLLIPYFFYGIFFTLLFSIKYFLSGNIPKEIIYEWIGILYSRYTLFTNTTTNNIVFLSLKNTSPFWFLTAMYLSFFWCYIIIKLKNKFIKISICVLYIIFTIYCYKLPILLPWSIDTSFLGALFILFGFYLKKVLPYFSNKLTPLIISTSLYILLVDYNGWINMSTRLLGSQGYSSILFFFLIGILYSIIICSIFIRFEKTILIKMFAYIGKYSLRIMCIHMTIFTLINKISFNVDLNKYIIATINITIVILICVFIEYYKKIYFNSTTILKWL